MRETTKKLTSLKFSKDRYCLVALLLTGLLCVFDVAAQPSAFTYQGKLNDGGTAANGSYDMQFKLFDAAADGTQVGSTTTSTNVQAVSGVFSVSLDFGSAAFSGADRYIEIAISPAGQNNFTTLSPRQKLNSSPYSIQTLNAANAVSALNALSLGGVAAADYVQDSDTRLSDARTPLPGSVDYIQNGTTAQSGTNFSIGGTGSATIFNASQYNINGLRFLSTTGTQNIFVGPEAGQNISSGFNNTFFGNRAGLLNTTGNHNTFIGQGAGIANTFGSSNIFLGQNAGNPNTSTQVSNSVAIGNGAVVENSNTLVLGSNGQTTIARGKLVAGFPSPSGQPFTPGAGWIETWSIPNGPDGLFAGNLVLRDFLNRPPSTAGPICYSNFSFGLTGGVILNRCASSFASVSDKMDVQPFTGGLELVKRLKPVSFKRKEDGSSGIGLNVEDVIETAPELVIRNEAAMVKKVNEDSLTVVLINAVKQQQKQIESQERQLLEQQRQIESLKDLVCRENTKAGVCKEN